MHRTELSLRQMQWVLKAVVHGIELLPVAQPDGQGVISSVSVRVEDHRCKGRNLNLKLTDFILPHFSSMSLEKKSLFFSFFI